MKKWIVILLTLVVSKVELIAQEENLELINQEKILEMNAEQQEAIIKEFMNSYMSVRDLGIKSENQQKKPTDPTPICTSGVGVPCRGTCPDFYFLCGGDDRPVKECDLFENRISYYGKYGSDIRQQYYVYMPSPGVTPKNEVVVLIHG